MKNIVTCFTKEEKEHIKELCDFTPTEETLFDLRKKEKSLEECAEIIIAAKNPDKEEIKYEISDFLYHAMVLMVEKGVTWEEITAELARR